MPTAAATALTWNPSREQLSGSERGEMRCDQCIQRLTVDDSIEVCALSLEPIIMGVCAISWN